MNILLRMVTKSFFHWKLNADNCNLKVSLGFRCVMVRSVLILRRLHQFNAALPTGLSSHSLLLNISHVNGSWAAAPLGQCFRLTLSSTFAPRQLYLSIFISPAPLTGTCKSPRWTVRQTLQLMGRYDSS